MSTPNLMLNNTSFIYGIFNTGIAIWKSKLGNRFTPESKSMNELNGTTFELDNFNIFSVNDLVLRANFFPSNLIRWLVNLPCCFQAI